MVVGFNICKIFLNSSIPKCHKVTVLPGAIYCRVRRVLNITYIFDVTKAFWPLVFLKGLLRPLTTRMQGVMLCVIQFQGMNTWIWLIFQFRNQYDSDVTVWSPQGRLHQVEYAMEAVKLGSATVGLKSKTHAVLIALKRASSELSAHQKKIIPIDTHIGITIAGLTADARILRYKNFQIWIHKESWWISI